MGTNRPKAKQIDATVKVSFGLSTTVSVTSRTYFSVSHIQAAVISARLAREIEAREPSDDNDLNQRRIADHRAHVTSSLMMSCAFLEATVNELFVDASDEPDHLLGTKQSLPSGCAEKLAAAWKDGKERPAWKDGKERRHTLQKVQLALSLCNAEPFNEGTRPYQDISALIDLRNALVHYKPEWIDHGETHNFECRLTSKRFQLNPLLPNNPFWPDRCLSYGCARWAIVQSLKFTDSFLAKLDVRPVYESVRDSLATE
jgi:hypothetical protein